MKKKVSFKIKLNNNNLRKATNFFSKYELINIIGDSEKKLFLGDKDKKYCRFCKESSPTVKFKKVPHVIPEFLGSHNLVSYFECDTCNAIFSRYETSFANFLGVSRTVSQIRGKGNKIPKFKDPRTGFEFKVEDGRMNIISIDGSDDVELDLENKSFTIKTKRPSYIPIHIPKLLLKIGLCMIEDNELIDFESTRKFVLDRSNEDKFKDSNFLRILGYFIPGPTKYKQPYIQLYRKKQELKSDLLPTYMLLFFIGHYQFQMVFSYCSSDNNLQGKNIDVPIAPLLIDNDHLLEFGEERFLNLNLTSDEKVKNQELNITFSFDSYEDKDLRK